MSTLSIISELRIHQFNNDSDNDFYSHLYGDFYDAKNSKHYDSYFMTPYLSKIDPNKKLQCSPLSSKGSPCLPGEHGGATIEEIEDGGSDSSNSEKD